MIYKILGTSKLRKKLITKSFYVGNSAGGKKENLYIVVHYTASLSSNPGSAENVRNYWQNSSGASAHYVVDDKEVIQCVEDYNSSWHCGGSLNKWQEGGGKFYGKCKNINSIGIEMCSTNKSGKPYAQCLATDKDWFFTPELEELTVQLIVDLMQKYNIGIDNVIMHFDVTGKWCPAPYLNDKTKWTKFKNRIIEEINKRKDEEDENMTKETFKSLFDEMRKEMQDNDAMEYSKEAREWAVNEGLITGSGKDANGKPNYMWGDMLTREQFVTVLYRLINKKKVIKRERV